MQIKTKVLTLEHKEHHHIDRPIAILGAGNMGSALMGANVGGSYLPKPTVTG